MNKRCAAMPLAFCVPGPVLGQEIVESKSGLKLAAKDGDRSLRGAGLRAKTMLKVKVYAVGLYVADSAIAGPLQGNAGTPQLYRELVNGDFKKTVIMKFVRDVTTDQIRDGFRDSLRDARGRTAEWIGYF